MSRRSLQGRLLRWVGVPVVALWLAAGLWMAQGARHETAEMFDRELERTAASVLAVIAATPGDSLQRGIPATVGADHDGARPEIVVRHRDGRVLLDASSLPALDAETAQSHFHTLRHDGERWRVFQRWDSTERHWVQVAAPLHDRDELLRALAQGTLVPLLALVVLLPLVTWLGLRAGLAPLRAISRSIAAQPKRTPTLSRDDVPGELLQLTRAVDELVATLDSALARERRFTADAAHELRHPLAVLQLELDLAADADGGTARREHLKRARDGLERMGRLVAQLLTLARVDSLDELPDAGAVPLAALAREEVAAASERAIPRGVEFSLDAPSEATVHGSRGLLEIAVRNLVDNAITHGRSPGSIVVSVRALDTWIEVGVDDDGPGLPEGHAARLGERFVRSTGSGSGLGLSIVQSIARLHGGTLLATPSPAGGARLLMRLPLNGPDATHPGAVQARGRRHAPPASPA